MDFYSTFGGLNNSLGTASTFVLEVDPEDTEIYFSRPNGGYELVLIKADSTGECVGQINKFRLNKGKMKRDMNDFQSTMSLFVCIFHLFYYK